MGEREASSNKSILKSWVLPALFHSLIYILVCWAVARPAGWVGPVLIHSPSALAGGGRVDWQGAGQKVRLASLSSGTIWRFRTPWADTIYLPLSMQRKCPVCRDVVAGVGGGGMSRRAWGIPKDPFHACSPTVRQSSLAGRFED